MENHQLKDSGHGKIGVHLREDDRGITTRDPKQNPIITPSKEKYLDVPLEVRINGDRINGLFHLLINGVYIGVIAH